MSDDKKRIQELEGALMSLRPYFGSLKKEQGLIGGSFFDVAAKAFALINDKLPTNKKI